VGGGCVERAASRPPATGAGLAVVNGDGGRAAVRGGRAARCRFRGVPADRDGEWERDEVCDRRDGACDVREDECDRALVSDRGLA